MPRRSTRRLRLLRCAARQTRRTAASAVTELRRRSAPSRRRRWSGDGGGAPPRRSVPWRGRRTTRRAAARRCVLDAPPRNAPPLLDATTRDGGGAATACDGGGAATARAARSRGQLTLRSFDGHACEPWDACVRPRAARARSYPQPNGCHARRDVTRGAPRSTHGGYSRPTLQGTPRLGQPRSTATITLLAPLLAAPTLTTPPHHTDAQLRAGVPNRRVGFRLSSFVIPFILRISSPLQTACSARL